MEVGDKDYPPMLAPEGSSETTVEGYMENYKNVSQDIKNQLDAEAEAIQIILTEIDNDIYSTVDACPNTCEMLKAIERLKQGESINVQDLETNLYWEFGKFTSRDGKTLESPQQAATRNKGKAFVNSPQPTYDQEPEMVAEDDALSKEKEIDKLMAQGCQKPKWAKDAAYPKEKMLSYAANNSRPIFDVEPLQKVQNDNDNYNVFTNDKEDPEQPEPVNDIYPDEKGDTNITTDSLDMNNNRGENDQDDDDLAKERDLLPSLIKKLKCKIDESKDCNTMLESSNKTLVDRLKREIEDFKNKNKCLESSNNHFKEANTKLSKNNQLMLKDLKKFQTKLDRYHHVNYASKMEFDCAQDKGELILYKMSAEKSFNEYNRKINDLNQTITEMKRELFAHQETISIMSQEKEAQKKFYKFVKTKKLKRKCMLNDNHDLCVLHYINGVNSRTKMPMAVPISTKEPKRNVNQSVATPLMKKVAAESTNQKPKSKIRKQYEHRFVRKYYGGLLVRTNSGLSYTVSGKDNGKNILKLIDEGPFKMGKFKETLAEGALHLGPERDRVFVDLTPEEKERFKADICATNILLQGSELMKDERKSQLYDEFEQFRQNNGETINEYYVRGLKTSTYDQLYAYLKQHEAHANENKMMLERYNQHAIDPLTFISNVSPQQYPTQSSAILQYAYVPPVTHQPKFANNTQFDLGLTSTDESIENLTKTVSLLIQSYKTHLPHTSNQLRPSSNTKNQATVQNNRVVLDEEQLLFIAGGQTNMFDDDVDEAPVQDLALNEENVFQADQCVASESDVDEAPTAQTMFMANLSSADPIYNEAGPSYDSDILSEYMKNKTEKVVQSNVSSVSNDALMMIINDMHEQAVQCVSANELYRVVNVS
uniref:Integrase, catalytic region, zinc finger, CCHC-type, peptidase aspartic, catalytic n=1 Tax=Tanacetum cinerariifolium TaxID=118510 RepID=A0A6L2N0R2_TANCI|nr:hypothetical protein [Tanacetum cinerariifolium]